MTTLVLNMGLKSLRSIIFDETGNKLASFSLPLETKIYGDCVEQNPQKWWEKALQVMENTLREKQIRDSVRHITVTSSSACLIPVDKKGRALHNAIMVSDRRARSESTFISTLLEFKQVLHQTNLACDPYLMLPKILWLKNKRPEIFQKTFKFLSPNDYLIYKMTGLFVTDSLNAQKYHYDLSSKSYPETLLNNLGIPGESLPTVVEPGTAISPLSEEIKKVLGFRHQVNVIVTTYDAICAFIGSGPRGAGEACDVSGTVTSLRVFSKHPLSEEKNRLFNTPLSKFNLNIAGGSNNLGGGLIEWVKQCYYPGEDNPYEVMEQEAQKSPSGAGGLVFLPYLLGERAPLWDPDARGVYFGLERTHTRNDLIRAVFESAGYCLKHLLEVLEENRIPVTKLRLSGGLTRLNLVSQIKADITGKEVLIIEEFETTSLGAAILAGFANGAYKSLSEASDSCVKIKYTLHPHESRQKIYREMYHLFIECYENLKPLFKKRAAVTGQIYPRRHYKLENL